jgi:type II secretory pathway pseudopilin PulG
MKKLLKLLLTYQLKDSKPRQKKGGFTLIELLVGLVLAFLVILPLLGFVVNIVDTDRREQAKTTSEQEIQVALSYIARDLDQAIYIYNATGIGEIEDQLPTVPRAEPVLVFWKRQFVPKSRPTDNPTLNCITAPDRDTKCDDAFVYSLVAYFLREPNPANCASDTWSCTNQILRFQTSDVVRDTQSANPTPYPGQIVDNGFQSFVNVTVSGTPPGDSPLEQKMNSWTKAGGSFKNQPDVLIDYIDRSPASRANRLRVDCPPEPNPRDRGPDNRPIRTWEGVPAQASNPNYSFYACVDPKRTTAKVFIRGNALARINTKTATPPTYVESQAAYFPRSSIQVKGRGLFSQDP